MDSNTFALVVSIFFIANLSQWIARLASDTNDTRPLLCRCLLQASGVGLALASVPLEQDAAYYEIHVEMASEGNVEIMAGVATKKDRQFYTALQESEGGR